ncbi:MarR family winged helix-turn-helix transcriptional regulator [Phreatobacter stygius]|uniref:MarR family transcriptional regulator n=1 Tax=Phreatobacter stygius TaxID=1940610 RepID=A0A4D7B8A3_9HYPH|nr:MarR family transcriptional regulator [Phreatobacter stygius]QCI66660.1 MarR family transcriptional regulator [Phreatobacter stygius]
MIEQNSSSLNQLQEANSGRRPWEVPGFASWLSVVRVHHACETAMTAALEPLGLNLSQYDILANLARQPGLAQGELAGRLLVGKSAVSMTLPDLERRGLITRERDADDGRIRRLNLTAQGQELATRALATHTAILDIMMSRAEPGDTAAVEAAMGRIYQALKAARAKPAAGR